MGRKGPYTNFLDTTAKKQALSPQPLDQFA